MAITYTPIDFRGKASEPVIEEILFQNNTISKGLVTFADNVKANTIFTEAGATVVQQALVTTGSPTSKGNLNAFDTIISPVQIEYYKDFDYNVLRNSRFNTSIQAGAWNMLSSEFERIVIGGIYAKKIALNSEYNFWNNVKTATKSAIAGLTPGAGQTSIGTAEQTFVAGLTIGEAEGNVSGLYDGIIAKMLYNNSNASATLGVGARVKVAGTTIDASNIKAEYDKIYAAIPEVTLNSQNEGVEIIIYAPFKHKQLINIFNNNVANFKDAFMVNADGSYGFNGIKIEFVPFASSNVVIVGSRERFFWLTDLTSDINFLQVEKHASPRKDFFIDAVMTAETHVANQKYNVLYIG
jgi:hypothetical protein